MSYGKRSNVQQLNSDESSSPLKAQFVDRRPSVATQLQQQQFIASSPKMTAQRAFANLLTTSPVQQQKILQRAAPEEELQMKSSAQLSAIKTLGCAPVQREVIQRAITIGTEEAKAPGLIATLVADYMGDFSYALASVRAVDGQTFETLDLLKAALPAPLTANQLYVGGAAVTVAGTGGRCNEHMTQAEVVTELRANKASISTANGNDQRIQIREGKTGSWKDGYVCLRFADGQLTYWHAHHGFAVG